MTSLVKRSRMLEAEFRQHGPDKARCAAAAELIKDVAQAGAVIGKLDDRLLLHGIMDYWASVLRMAATSNMTPGEGQEIVVSPPLAAYDGSSGESEDGLTRITLDEFLRLIDRRELLTNKKLSKAVVPPTSALLQIGVIDSQFRECTLSGVRFADGSRFITTSFIRCRLDRVVVRKALFIECRFIGTELGGADFRESDFTRALFTASHFDDRTHFLQANFTNAKLQEVRGQEVTFTEANFTAAELSNAQLTGCHFGRADLKGAKLWRSDFRGSDFVHATLKDTDLDGASFVNCDLEDANFEGARNIERADFTGSTWRAAKFDPLVREALETRSLGVGKAAASGGTAKIVDLRTGTHK